MPDPVLSLAGRRIEVGLVSSAALLFGVGLLLFLFDDGGRARSLPPAERARTLLEGRDLPRLVALTLPRDGTLLDLARGGALSLSRDPDVLVRWLDPLTRDTRLEAPFFGAGVDGITFVPDGDGRAWLWVSHAGLLSGAGQRLPRIGVGPRGEALTLALWMKAYALIRDDATSNAWSREERDAFVLEHRRQVGASRMHLLFDKGAGRWRLDPEAGGLRLDATPQSLVALDSTGASVLLPGMLGGGGGLTPWGTILVAEADDGANGFGEVEVCWREDGTLEFEGWDARRFQPGALIDPPRGHDPHAALGRVFEPEDQRARDAWGWLVEIDPDLDETHPTGRDGSSHRKLGLLGRARWIGAAVATAADGTLAPGHPIVLYAADRREGGRLWKFVSKAPYVDGMDRFAVRALLGEGTLHVSHVEREVPLSSGATSFAGRWIRLALASTDPAPNAAQLGDVKRTVGATLADVDVNGLGAFRDDGTVRRCLFTACKKIGIRDLGALGVGVPGDVAFDRTSGRLFVSTGASTGSDGGAILALRETDSEAPAFSMTFLLEILWRGPPPPAAAAHPVDLLLDAHGTVCFSADGGLYVLDPDGASLRLVAAPGGSSLTAPCLTPDGRTLLVGVRPGP